MNVVAHYVVGDVRSVMASMPDLSVDMTMTSPPYWRKRSYIDPDDPVKQMEIGQETSPGEFLATLLGITDELWRVTKDSGTAWFNIGDTAAGSGGWGGDVDKDNRGGGRRWVGTNGSQTAKADMPKPKSVCWIPELFGASLAYGRNLLTGEPCRQWIVRPQIVWCKPSPTPGEIIDKFREATELIVWMAKRPDYYFDLDAVREPPKEDWGSRVVNSGAFRGHPNERDLQSRPDRACNERGVPPKNWWVITSARDGGGHVAPYPSELIERPIKAACPPGGVVFDPFGGSGTTGAVATGHGHNCVMVDLDRSNVRRALDRVGPMFFQETSAKDLADWLKGVTS